MADLNNTGAVKKQGARECAIVELVYQIFNQANLYRVTFASQWEEIAQLVMPNMRNTFMRENYNFPGLKKTDRQIDASGMVALRKFAAICDSMLTPFSSNWLNLECPYPDVQKNRAVRLWFEQASNVLFHLRYIGEANFRMNNQSIFQQVGAFGNGPMFIDQLYDMHNRPVRGFRYKALPIGEVFIRTNHQGQVDAFVRAYRLTARQVGQQFGTDDLPEELTLAAAKNSEQLFDMFHCVYPNTEYDPNSLIGPGSKPFVSYHVSCTGRWLLREGGYNSFPLAYARYGVPSPGEIYTRGPTGDILPSLKTLNAEKATFLKTGHRAGDPVLLTPDDGLTDFSLRPGAMNKGGVTADGKPLVHVLPTGNIQITDKMMDEERNLIGESYLTKLFSALVENPQMTATQVIEVINQKGIFLAPTVGSMSSDYLDPMIIREMDLAVQLRLLPPMPPLLKEAKGEYKIVYVSPLFKAARAGQAAGFLRTVETALEVAGQMQDPSILDPFDFDTAIPDIARIQDTPESWMADDNKIAAKRQARAKQQAAQQQVQALPAQAAMLKARAQVAQRGGAQLQTPPGSAPDEAPQ